LTFLLFYAIIFPLQAWGKPALADFKKYIRKTNKNIERPIGERRKVMIEILLVLTIVVGMLWILSNAIFKIPAYHYGVLERFGERIGNAIEEGLRVKIPFINEIELISLELGELDIQTSFTMSDKLQLIVRGSLQYRPDPKIVDNEGKNVFITMSEDIIKSGIEDAIQSLLGGLGGVYKADDFIGNRQALADLLNAILRLAIPPHLKDDPNVEAKELIKFYNNNWRLVRNQINQERHQENDYSPIEKRYGIDVEAFALSQVDFSEETKKSFEKEKQAEARGRAFNTKIEMAKKVIALGASPQVALNAADVSLDSDVKKNVVSVEGEAGVIGGILANLKGGK